jgi:hypothetical protein
VELAAKKELIDGADLAVDSVRLQADASTKSVRTLSRSQERLEELAAVDIATLDEGSREIHAAKVQKHQEAVKRCLDEARTSLSVTTPSAGLMKFPNGAALPGHRVTVVSTGVRLRFVVAVLLGSTPTDHDLLRPALLAARETLTKAGVTSSLCVAADAGFRSHDDFEFAISARPDIDVLIHDPPDPRRGKSKVKGGLFSKSEFDFREDGTVSCPANLPMHGPVKAGGGKLRWRGVGCQDCALRPRCTTTEVREVIVDPDRERLHRAMAERMAKEGAEERYRRRIATVEPVFSYIEDTMRFTRLSSRLSSTVEGEILLKVLAYNLYRLFFCPSAGVAIIEAFFDGFAVRTGRLRLLPAAALVGSPGVRPFAEYFG